MTREHSDRYFECHVTIDPVFEEQFEQVRAIAERHQFRVAELLMQKRAADTLERSKYDTFMTGRGSYYTKLKVQMEALVAELSTVCAVRRCKIEETLFDTKFGDKLNANT